jgi:hypothetical protein
MYKIVLFLLEITSARRNKKDPKDKHPENKDRITLKINNDNKFLGLNSDNKITLVDYENALYIKLNTMENITDKTLEGKDNKALTEKGWLFFPKSYSFQNNTSSSKQHFKIVYYGPNEYILMKDDSCLGWTGDSKFKKVDCKLGKAAIFNICTGKYCDSYVDIRKDLDCIKNLLKIQSGRSFDNNDSSMDSDDFNGDHGRNYKNNYNNRNNSNRNNNNRKYGSVRPYHDRRNRRGDSFSSDDSDYFSNGQRHGRRDHHRNNGNYNRPYSGINDYDNPLDSGLIGCKEFAFPYSRYNQNGLNDIFSGRHLGDNQNKFKINGINC